MDEKIKAIVNKYINNTKEETDMKNVIAIFVQKSLVNKKWVSTGYVITQVSTEDGVKYIDSNNHVLDVNEIEVFSEYVEGFVDSDSTMFYAQIIPEEEKNMKKSRKERKAEKKAQEQAVVQVMTDAVVNTMNNKEEETMVGETITMEQLETMCDNEYLRLKEETVMVEEVAATRDAEKFVNGVKENFEKAIKTMANKSTEFRAFMKKVSGMTDAEAEAYLKENYDKVMGFMKEKASNVREDIEMAKLFNPGGDFSDEGEVIDAEQTFAEIIKSKELSVWGKIKKIVVKVIKFLVRIIIATAKFLFKVACALIVGVFKIGCIAVNTAFNVGEVVVDEAKPHVTKARDSYRNWKATRAVSVDEVLDDEDDFEFDEE